MSVSASDCEEPLVFRADLVRPLEGASGSVSPPDAESESSTATALRLLGLVGFLDLVDFLDFLGFLAGGPTSSSSLSDGRLDFLFGADFF